MLFVWQKGAIFVRNNQKRNQMRIAVLGANGFIGRRILQRLAGSGAHTLLGVSRQPDLLPSSGYRFEQVDLCQREVVEELLARFRPEVVFNTVAMSSVDFCQQHPAEAYAINVEAVATLVELCNRQACRLIHLSTDFVFEGTQQVPYTEEDRPAAVNIYGQQKAEAEWIIQEACRDYAVMRVEVVYGTPYPGQHGNIVQLVKTRLGNGQPIQVVSDQVRTPTWVEDIARGAELLLPSAHQGIFHICGGEAMSIAEIAYRVARHFRLDESLIRPVTTAALQEATPRPRYTAMSIAKAQRSIGYQATSLEEALAHC